MSRRGDQAGTFELLARLPGQFIALAKAEIENAKREISGKAKRAGIGLLSIIIALFFLFFAISALVAAAVAGLAVVWPVWLSALVVGGALVLLAAAAILGGIALIKRGVPVPAKTIERVEDDLKVFGEVRFNASAHAPRNPTGSGYNDPGAQGPGRSDEGGRR